MAKVKVTAARRVSERPSDQTHTTPTPRCMSLLPYSQASTQWREMGSTTMTAAVCCSWVGVLLTWGIPIRIDVSRFIVPHAADFVASRTVDTIPAAAGDFVFGHEYIAIINHFERRLPRLIPYLYQLKPAPETGDQVSQSQQPYPKVPKEYRPKTHASRPPPWQRSSSLALQSGRRNSASGAPRTTFVRVAWSARTMSTCRRARIYGPRVPSGDT